MTVETWLAQNIARLTAAGIATARLDCLVLLENVLNTNRTQILAHLDQELTGVVTANLDGMVSRRAEHIPLAYILGKTEFYGRQFIVNNHVLEPRPESETIIGLLGSVIQHTPHIIDVGTGSGALAITAKLEHPAATVTAIDVDPLCLEVTQENAAAHNVTIEILQGDLLEPLMDRVFDDTAVLLCNLPYVPDAYQINTAATHEPSHAIFGGHDGLELYRRLFAVQLQKFSNIRYILCESLPPQHEQLASIAFRAGFKQIAEEDFIQVFELSNNSAS